MICKIRC